MTALEKNLKYYMGLKGIKKYTDLLRAIGHYLGEDGYDFANRNKSNFSKMLQDKNPRRFNFNYIVPIEKILGVSFARLLDEESYKLPVDKIDIPFNKGFRYYAYVDDRDLYEKELDKLLTKSGESVLTQNDEFGKTFLDYVVEYNSVNGIRFLRDHYHLKLRSWNNNFDTTPRGMFWVNDKGIELARMIANMNDVELFNDIYDPYYLFALCGYYLPDSIYSQDEYFEIILDYENLFNSLFEIKEYVFQLGRRAQIKRGIKEVTFKTINPVLNGVLNYTLKNVDKYKKYAEKILEFGIKHNNEVIQKLNSEHKFVMTDEIGGIHENNGDIIDILILPNVKDVNDGDIRKLIEQLPRFEV